MIPKTPNVKYNVHVVFCLLIVSKYEPSILFQFHHPQEVFLEML